MESYTTILIILLVLFVFVISWVFFGKIVVLKVVPPIAALRTASNVSLSRANNQDAHEAEVAAATERAEKRAAKRAAKEEAIRKAEEEQALKEAAAMCPNCKVHGQPSAVSDITDYLECCERHKSVPHKTVFSVASTESTV
ncbi:hypothetical protein BKA65DRAFT_476896 [Rhexocercosporidium sp. MPI-PUGE-AT-0058]|nr:hypothetical protein BKA65DRAFT_476896 [Rhexocercosporidium sp. MPI-PUGE-AT-0058]